MSATSLSVDSGQVHAPIGPNGAGKTTTFNLVSGMFVPDAGSVKLHGRAIHHLPPHRICQQGLARSFQITNLFKGLTIYENLRLSLQARHPARFNVWRDIDSFPEIHAETAELMKFLGLEGIEDTLGGDLSYGGQRLVDLGIALGSKPQVLLMDEPLASLAAGERERVSRLVRTIASGIPVLIVEHNIDRVLDLSQRVTAMNEGEVLMTGTPAGVRTDPRVQAVCTGSGTPPLNKAPRTAAEARFSLPYVVTTALVHGSVRLAAFAPERLADAQTRELMARVDLNVDSEVDAAFPGQRAARVAPELTCTQEPTRHEHFRSHHPVPGGGRHPPHLRLPRRPDGRVPRGRAPCRDGFRARLA